MTLNEEVQAVEEELSDVEEAILAEGRKVRATIEAEALNLRKSAIVKELEEIEAKLAAFVSADKPAKPPAAKPVKEEPKVEAKKPPAKS